MHSLTLMRSVLRDSATVNLTPGDSTITIKGKSSAYSPEGKKAPKCAGGTITGLGHNPAELLTH